MAYPPRIHICGGTYFITSRCLNFEPFLHRSEMKDIVLLCIAKAQQKYVFELSAFGILDNELKITIRTTNINDTVSKIMQHIKANITRMVNRRSGRTGTIWNSRFSSMVVECIAETAACIRRHIFAAAGEFRGKMFIPFNAEYSSIGVYISPRHNELLMTVHKAFLLLGLNMKTLVFLLGSFGAGEQLDAILPTEGCANVFDSNK